MTDKRSRSLDWAVESRSGKGDCPSKEKGQSPFPDRLSGKLRKGGGGPYERSMVPATQRPQVRSSAHRVIETTGGRGQGPAAGQSQSIRKEWQTRLGPCQHRVGAV